MASLIERLEELAEKVAARTNWELDFRPIDCLTGGEANEVVNVLPDLLKLARAARAYDRVEGDWGAVKRALELLFREVPS
jgi:hypothetical protein